MRLTRLLRLRCPICGAAKLFKGYFDSPVQCPNCRYFFMRESGYFLPHVAIGYGFTILASLGSWPALYYLFGIRSAAVTLAVMITVAVVFGVWFVRYSKAIWLAIDLTMNPPVSEDFEPRGRG